LKRQSLHFGSWEALNDPTLFVGLAIFDNLGNQINNDFVINILIIFETILDFLANFTLLANFFSEKITCRDALPTEMFGQEKSILLPK